MDIEAEMNMITLSEDIDRAKIGGDTNVLGV